jgi:hypothetical protein
MPGKNEALNITVNREGWMPTGDDEGVTCVGSERPKNRERSDEEEEVNRNRYADNPHNPHQDRCPECDHFRGGCRLHPRDPLSVEWDSDRSLCRGRIMTAQRALMSALATELFAPEVHEVADAVLHHGTLTVGW